MSKKFLQEFYKSDAVLDRKIMEKYIHPDISIEWHSTKGYRTLNRERILDVCDEMGQAYVWSNCKVSHIVAKGDEAAVRYSHYVKTVENPREEMLLAHFTVFWEIRDGRLYRGYQMSQF
jgi:hypothetical protein